MKTDKDCWVFSINLGIYSSSKFHYIQTCLYFNGSLFISTVGVIFQMTNSKKNNIKTLIFCTYSQERLELFLYIINVKLKFVRIIQLVLALDNFIIGFYPPLPIRDSLFFPLPALILMVGLDLEKIFVLSLLPEGVGSSSSFWRSLNSA